MSKCLQITYNPFGIKDKSSLIFYKHIFPSGIQDKFILRHKTDNFELF